MAKVRKLFLLSRPVGVWTGNRGVPVFDLDMVESLMDRRA